jgi:hypothetical protein
MVILAIDNQNLELGCSWFLCETEGGKGCPERDARDEARHEAGVSFRFHWCQFSSLSLHRPIIPLKKQHFWHLFKLTFAASDCYCLRIPFGCRGISTL